MMGISRVKIYSHSHTRTHLGNGFLVSLFVRPHLHYVKRLKDDDDDDTMMFGIGEFDRLERAPST